MNRIAWSTAVFLTVGPHLHAAEEPLPAQGQSSALSLEFLSITRERPLFSPDRRKATPPTAAVAPSLIVPQNNPTSQDQATPRLALTGIIEAPAGITILLRDLGTSGSIAVHPGDSVGRWHVLADSRYAVKLKNGDEEVRLEMFAGP